MVDTAIFLGAGASKAEGAPLQGQLFREYFSSNLFKNSNDQMDRELAAFFLEMFQIDVDNGEIPTINFPTFEEVLGLTDLAIMRKESFRNFDVDNRAINSGRLSVVAQYLVFLVARVLDHKLRNRATLHRRLVDTLRRANRLREIAFISTNYDILIDNALAEERTYGIDLDYGVDFRNFERIDDWRRPAPDRCVNLFKPHGSLNWLLCPTCNELEMTPGEKGVVTQLIANFIQARCPMCHGIYTPLIVPPTFYKDMNNVFLATIWNRMGVTLRKVNHLIFCGYSFPDADMHIKYLLKRVQTNSDTQLKFTVINHYVGKQPDQVQQEECRFKRFLGNRVHFARMSFEDFVANPLAVARR